MKIRQVLTLYPLFWISVAAACGIILSRINVLSFYNLGGLALLFIILSCFLKSWKSAITLFLATCFVFQFYAQTRNQVLSDSDVRKVLGDRAQTGEVVLTVLDLPLKKVGADQELRKEFLAEARAVKDLSGERAVEGRMLVVVRQPTELRLVPGQKLRVTGFWQKPRATVNPGEFDYRSFLENKRIYYILKSTGDSVHEIEPSRDLFGIAAYSLREYMLAVLKIGLEDDPQVSGLMAGMLFGYKEGIAEEVEEAFRTTGTLHLFAVSGQNVGIILGMLLIVLQVTGLIRWRWGWLVLPFLLIFCLATGMQPSAMRAFLMAAVILFAWSLYRPVSILNVLSLAALMAWVLDPQALFDVGFQLSFMVVLAMVLGTEPLMGKIYSWGKPDPWIPIRLLSPWRLNLDQLYRIVCGGVAASICAWGASQVLILYYFNLFSPISLVTNIVVMPMAALILVTSAVSVAGSWVSSIWALCLNQVNWVVLNGMVAVIELFAVVPGGHFYVAAPWNQLPHDEVRITLFESRQASPMIIQANGRAWFLDSGTEYSWNSAINRFRQQQGINRAAGVIVSKHGADHMGGMSDLMSQVPAGFWAESGFRSRSRSLHQWLKEMELAQIPKQFWRQGDRFEWEGGLRAEVLWPPLEPVNDRQDDQGLVLRFTKKNNVMLYAGDISTQVERELIRSGVSVEADILVQGEHSQEGNLSEDWVAAVKPRWVIRSARGFHPDRDLTLERLDLFGQQGVKVLRMEQTGAIQIRIGQDGKIDLSSWSAELQSFK